VVRARTDTHAGDKTVRLTSARAVACGTVDSVRNDGGRATRASLRGRLPLALVIGLGAVLAAAAVAGGLELSLSTKPAASSANAGHPAAPGGATSTPGSAPGDVPPSSHTAPPTTTQPPTLPTSPATTTTAPAGTGLPGVVDDCSGPAPTGTRTAVRPASIMIACADGGLRLEDLTWTSWTAKSADAHGVLLANDCTPDCAQGTFHRFAGTFELSNPEPSSRGVVFSEVTATYTQTVPDNRTGGPITHFTLEVPRTTVGV
jgi:hypothetical protein